MARGFQRKIIAQNYYKKNFHISQWTVFRKGQMNLHFNQSTRLTFKPTIYRRFMKI